MTLFDLLFQHPLMFFAFVIVFLLSLSVHEFSHALMGDWLGDHTARRMNRLTLNPLAHVDPLGFLALVTVGFGWGKPVPFNPLNLRYRTWGPTLVAVAGPLSNLLMGTLAALAFGFFDGSLGSGNLLVITLGYAAKLNYLLLFFNLIPIPPLDGSKALLAALAAPRYAAIRTSLELQGPFLLMGLIVLDALFNLHIFAIIDSASVSLLTHVAQLLG